MVHWRGIFFLNFFVSGKTWAKFDKFGVFNNLSRNSGKLLLEFNYDMNTFGTLNFGVC